MKLENVTIVANRAGGNYIKSYVRMRKFGYVQSVAELSTLLYIIKYFENKGVTKNNKFGLIF